MKGLIVYDSLYGNTEKIALAIGEALGNLTNIAVIRVGEVKSRAIHRPGFIDHWVTHPALSTHTSD